MPFDPKQNRMFQTGYSYLFNDDKNKIEFWFSWLSGLEVVYVNGKKVSSKRSFRAQTKHDFLIGERQYSIRGKANIFSMRNHCSLEKNGMIISQKKLSFSKEGKPIPVAIDTFIGMIIALVIFTICKVNYDWPQWSYYAFVCLLVVLQPIVLFKRIKPEIKDIDFHYSE